MTSRDARGVGLAADPVGAVSPVRVVGLRNKPVIGVTGGIGAGKSSVADAFGALGAAVIDSDRMAHAQLEQREVIDTLVDWWGDSILRPDGGIDRRAVASIVFEDAEQLRRLEGLLYPRMDEVRRRMMAELETNADVTAIVLDTPKLYEAGLDSSCDAVVFVDADDATRASRVAAKRGWSRDELRRREKSMNALDKKRARADYVVTNLTSIEDLRQQVNRVFASVLESFRG